MQTLLEFPHNANAKSAGQIISFGKMSININLAPRTEDIIRKAAALSGDTPATLYAEYAHTLIEDYFPVTKRRCR